MRLLDLALVLLVVKLFATRLLAWLRSRA